MLVDALIKGVKSGCLKSSIGVGTVTIKKLQPFKSLRSAL